MNDEIQDQEQDANAQAEQPNKVKQQLKKAAGSSTLPWKVFAAFVVVGIAGHAVTNAKTTSVQAAPAPTAIVQLH
jgi:hypothetical protein